MADPHDIPPRSTDDPSPEVLAALPRIQSSEYFATVAPLQEFVVGRQVRGSLVGHAGFILFLDDRTWVATYLQAGVLRWAGGAEAEGLPGEYVDAIFSPEYGDGRQPLASGFFAEGFCDIAAEVEKAKDQVIQGISFGENTFNFRFPNGRELDTVIGPTHNGKLALRVFWEQW